jgi:1-acyl-sn-glycerol-3-phosphate acyltransferase
MSRALSLYTAYQVARISVPTFFEAMVGRVDRHVCDLRLRSFGHRVVDSAHIDLDVRGLDRVPADRAFVYMSNHQSHIDIPILYATVPARTLRMVAKAELFKIPVWGRAMRASGMIEVDRKNRTRAVESLKRAEAAVADGVSIWIAPEGSRSRTGELAPLKKGGFYLAKETGTPIVPVAISGTHAILPPETQAMTPGKPVRVVFGAPIEVEGRSVPELMDAVADFLAANVVPATGDDGAATAASPHV